MRLRIHHRTRYRYSVPVSENYNEVRLQPVSNATQECHRFEISTEPSVGIRRYHDLHLNLVDHFYVAEPHDGLVVESRSEVSTQGPGDRLAQAAFPLSRIGEECRRLERCYDFLQTSEYVPLDVGVWREAQDAAAGRTDAWDAAQALMRHVHATVAYDAAATHVHTRMSDVQRERRGVCQDFSHLLIGLCRSIKIPARYVSGYLYAGDRPGWRGALASHAWVEVFVPGHDWLPLDPTNDQPANEHHVKVAVGRDYADAAPLRGSFKGRASQQMDVEIEILRV